MIFFLLFVPHTLSLVLFFLVSFSFSLFRYE